MVLIIFFTVFTVLLLLFADNERGERREERAEIFFFFFSCVQAHAFIDGRRGDNEDLRTGTKARLQKEILK